MKNIRDIKNFYTELNKLDSLDCDWALHVGEESSPGIYIDDGSLAVSGKTISDTRQQLEKVRQMLGIKTRNYRTKAQRDAVRLLVTYYRKFDLNNHQIAPLTNLSESTLRHDYPPLKEGESLHPAYVLKLRNQYGRTI